MPKPTKPGIYFYRLCPQKPWNVCKIEQFSEWRNVKRDHLRLSFTGSDISHAVDDIPNGEWREVQMPE